MASGTSRNPPAAFAFPVAVADGAGGGGPGIFVSNPLPLEPAHFVVSRRYAVDARYYHRGDIATGWLPLDTPDPGFPQAYLVAEEDERRIDNILFFRRDYASIPDIWEQVGSAVVTVPGIQSLPTLASAVAISGFANGAPYWNSGNQDLFSSAHGLSAGDRIRLTISFTHSNAQQSRQKSFSQDVTVAAATTDTFSVPIGPIHINGNPSTFITAFTGSFRKYTGGYPLRSPRVRSVPVAISRAYYLPGVSPGINDPEDIVLPDTFSIENSEAAEDFPENTVGDETTPTAATYWGWVQSNAGLVLEATLEPYLGNILVARTATWRAR